MHKMYYFDKLNQLWIFKQSIKILINQEFRSNFFINLIIISLNFNYLIY